MLKKLNISASGYYGHFKSEPSKSKQRKNRLTKEIKDIYEKSYRIYGSPKITAILKKNGETVSQKYVYTIMKENSLKARYIKPYTITTTGQESLQKLKICSTDITIKQSQIQRGAVTSHISGHMMMVLFI